MEVEDHPYYHRNKTRCLLHIFKTKVIHKFSSPSKIPKNQNQIFTYVWIYPMYGSCLCCVLHLAMYGVGYQEVVKAENNIPDGFPRAPEVGGHIYCHLVTTWPSGAAQLSPSMGPVVVWYKLAKDPYMELETVYFLVLLETSQRLTKKELPCQFIRSCQEGKLLF